MNSGRFSARIRCVTMQPERSGSETLRDDLAADTTVAEAPGLNRAEKRNIMREYRAFRVRAARARNVECKRRGIGTPALRIETALRLANPRYNDAERVELASELVGPR